MAKDFGVEVNGELKAEEKKLVTLDVIINVLEKTRPFTFVTGKNF